MYNVGMLNGYYRGLGKSLEATQLFADIDPVLSPARRERPSLFFRGYGDMT